MWPFPPDRASGRGIRPREDSVTVEGEVDPRFDRVRTAQGMAADLIELHAWDPVEGIRYSRVV